jgi:DNA helicase-2/ATP-dependent DNA helicase PcrA
MSSKPSSFLAGLPDELLERKKTPKARSMGRGYMGGSTSSLGRSSGGGWGGGRYERGAGAGIPTAAARRPGVPVERAAPSYSEAEASQEATYIEVGARVRHRKFGTGTIAELAGSGRDLKAKIDFDDETLGRKTLVVAQANLELAID